MNTPSHFLINAALRRGAWSRHAPPRTPFLVGAVLPDVPLAVLALGTYLRARLDGVRDTGAVMRDAFDERYFRDPLWIAAHNLFHAPALLVIALVFLWRYRHPPASRLRWAFWLFAGCAIHALIDLATHYDDGPLLFFPFAWTIRLHSPVSYGDRRHYGSQFFVFELALDAALVAYLAWTPVRCWFARCRARTRPWRRS
jgi:hypothetical protein